MKYDLHMHSHFSMDTNEPMEEMVQASITKNLTEICFTDHIEFYTDVQGRPPALFDPDAYQDEIARLKSIYGDQIEIKTGVEYGYQPQSVAKINAFSKQMDLDFIICSVHEVDKQAFHLHEYGQDQTVKEAFERYFKACHQCVHDGIEFSILGHFDLLKRYIPYGCEKQVFNDHFDVIEATFKHLISLGKGIEVNTSGFRYGLGQTHPTLDFLKLYRALGGEVVTVGSDAHTAAYVASEFAYATALLKEAGFRYLTRFEKLKAAFIKI